MSKKRNSKFKQAVLNTPDIRNCFFNGLGSLGNHSAKVEIADTRYLEGSVDIDTCTRNAYPNANRWDYVIGFRGHAYFMEVHSANTGEVSTVMRKLQWLKDWLNNSAPQLSLIKAPSNPYVWVQSKGFQILKNSPQYRAAVQAGILPVKTLKLQ